MNVTRCTTEYRKVSSDANQGTLISSVARLVEALQCHDPRCQCRRTARNKHTLHCPAHPDEHPSLAVTVQGDKVLLHCFAGCSPDAVIGALRERGLWGQERTTIRIPSGKAPNGAPPFGLTLAALADAKKLPAEELRRYGLNDCPRHGAPAVRMIYHDAGGAEIGVRYRRSLATEPRFEWRKGDHVALYGQTDLAKARRLGYVFIVEGESDCWTLWHYGLPAIGAPGKSTWKREWAALLAGVGVVYVWQEPQAEDFALRIGADIPAARVIRAPEDAKDPSALHVLGRDVVAEMERLRAAATPVAEMLLAARDARVQELAAAAGAVLAAEDPLDLVEASIRAHGYGGDTRPVMIAYCGMTSRVLAMRFGAMPAHLLFLGPASAGKSYTVQTCTRLLPPEAYHVIDASSPRVMIYDDAELRHRVVIFGEADSLPAGEDNPAASALRGLLQDNYLHYKFTMRDKETGAYTVHEIEKEGPTVLVTTAVKSLGDQLMTRLFTVEMADDPVQVQAALRTQAALELTGARPPDEALIAFQAYLQTRAPWQVVVPFVDRLAAAIAKSAAAPRILRDFSRLLALVKSVAVLRHRWRQVDESGRLVAEIPDYETIRQLCDGLFADSVTEGASARVKDAVAAVYELCQERAQGENVTVAKVAKRLGISRSAATRRLGMAIAMGWVVNSEHRSRHPWILEPGEPVPEISALPVLQAEANDEDAVASDDGGDAVHDPLEDAQPPDAPAGSPPPTQVGEWLLDDLEDWQLSYIREAEAIDN
jgi:hypothetical protein